MDKEKKKEESLEDFMGGPADDVFTGAAGMAVKDKLDMINKTMDMLHAVTNVQLFQMLYIGLREASDGEMDQATVDLLGRLGDSVERGLCASFAINFIRSLGYDSEAAMLYVKARYGMDFNESTGFVCADGDSKTVCKTVEEHWNKNHKEIEDACDTDNKG